MSILPIETVRGEHLVSREAPKLKNLNGLIGPAEIEDNVSLPVQSLRYRLLLDQPVLEIIDGAGQTHLIDAATGKARQPITSEQAKQITRSAWLQGAPDELSVEKITTGSVEYRGPLPAWRVSDPDDVRVYVPLATGEIKAVRTNTWRFYDFFWSLHIMDWKNHENFNSWWLIAFALGGVCMAVSGLILLANRWPLRRVRKARMQYD